MKKINITVEYDEEKLSALKMYLEQKGQTVEGELQKSLEGLYNKNVPAGVREYLQLKAEPSKVKSKRSVISSAIAAGADEEVTDGK